MKTIVCVLLSVLIDVLCTSPTHSQPVPIENRKYLIINSATHQVLSISTFGFGSIVVNTIVSKPLSVISQATVRQKWNFVKIDLNRSLFMIQINAEITLDVPSN